MTLSATRAKALKDPGRYSDGGGLHLYISKAGGKSWVQRITIDERRRDIGLGGFPSVSLARAREKAAENRAAVAEGRDPLADRHAPAMPTFREAAGAAHEANRPRWRNAKHIASWMQTLERHAMPTLGATPLGRIDRGEVLRVLTPIWTTRPETARRVRQRMRTVFRWAMAHGFMETSPAGEAIDGALPPMPKVKAHLRALPYQDVGSALETVEGSQASIPAKLCFRFLVLTAARSGEARGARWEEIDLQGHVWRIPSERMKAGKEHRAPLSVQALELLGEASALRDESGLVFPSPLKPGAPMSDMTLTKLLRSTGLSERATVHGFRSSFKNWTLEQTDAPWALGLEQGVRAVGRDGRRSIPINGAGDGPWLSLGAPMAVLGSGAGAGSAGQYAGEDNRGPGRCDSVGRLGSLVDGSGAVGAVRQAMAGLAIEPGRE